MVDAVITDPSGVIVAAREAGNHVANTAAMIRQTGAAAKTPDVQLTQLHPTRIVQVFSDQFSVISCFH